MIFATNIAVLTAAFDEDEKGEDAGLCDLCNLCGAFARTGAGRAP